MSKKKVGDLFKLLLSAIIVAGRSDLLHPIDGVADNPVLKILKKLYLFSNPEDLIGKNAELCDEYKACAAFFVESNADEVKQLVGLIWNIFAMHVGGTQLESEPSEGSSSEGSSPPPLAKFPLVAGVSLPPPGPPPPPSPQ